MIRLKELREERNFNMSEAARFLHQKYTTYVNHEKGNREPNSEDLKAYANAYDVSIDYLIGRTNIKKPSPQVTDGKNYEEFKQIVDQLNEENAALLKEQALLLLKHQKSQDGL